MEALIADIKTDITFLQKGKNSIIRKLERLKTETDYENIDSHVKAIAGSLHSIYTGCENILERIIRAIDGDIPLGKDYHSQILRRAVNEIESLRPAIIHIHTYAKLDEFRAYRYKFRNIYLYLITPGRIKALSQEGIELVDAIEKDIQKFIQFLVLKKSV